MRGTKIIDAVANPVSLDYMNDICSHKGALKDVIRMWQKGGTYLSNTSEGESVYISKGLARC